MHDAEVLTNQHVDDLSHGFGADNEEQATRKSERIAELVAGEIAKAKLTIANKKGGGRNCCVLEGPSGKNRKSLVQTGAPFQEGR